MARITARRTEPSTLDRARAALSETQGQLDQLDAQYLALSNDLGDALARSRMGDKRASEAAGTLSMRRAGVDTERDRLRLEASALHARIETLESEAATIAAAGAVSTYEHLTDRARALEHTLAEQMRAASATAAELQRIAVSWETARNTVAQAGHDTSQAVAPRNPASLFQPRVITDPEPNIATWQAPPYDTLHQTPAKLSYFRDQPKGDVIHLDRDLASEFALGEPA